MNIDVKRLQTYLNKKFTGCYKILVKIDKSDSETIYLDLLVNQIENQNPVISEKSFYCGKIYVTVRFYPKTYLVNLTEINSFVENLFNCINEFLKEPTTECLNGFRLKIQEIISEIEDLDKIKEIPKEHKEILDDPDNFHTAVWCLSGAALHLKKIKKHLDKIINQSDLVEG